MTEKQQLIASNLIAYTMMMRQEQKAYFKTIGKAKKTKLTEDFSKAKIHLEKSKGLEKKVDDYIVRATEEGLV